MARGIDYKGPSRTRGLSLHHVTDSSIVIRFLFAGKRLMPDKQKNELPKIAFPNQKAWEKWLKENHLSSTGIWLQLAKKTAATPSVTYPEAIEVALCYGWIDGQKKSHGAETWLQKFTPRGRKSIWSKINCEKALALIESRKMKPAGLSEVERAKQDGRWEQAYDSP